jgi:hypothetical protein
MSGDSHKDASSVDLVLLGGGDAKGERRRRSGGIDARRCEFWGDK